MNGVYGHSWAWTEENESAQQRQCISIHISFLRCSTFVACENPEWNVWAPLRICGCILAGFVMFANSHAVARQTWINVNCSMWKTIWNENFKAHSFCYCSVMLETKSNNWTHNKCIKLVNRLNATFDVHINDKRNWSIWKWLSSTYTHAIIRNQFSHLFFGFMQAFRY